MGKIIALEGQSTDENFNPAVNSEWQEQVQASLDAIHSGVKGGQSAIALTGVKGVHDITKPGEVEINFRESRPELDKRICNALGIPSEKIGIPRSTTLQYQPSVVENVVNAQYDATINSLTKRAATFFNDNLLQKHLGIYDAKLIPAGRWGAITLAAAQTLVAMAEAGPLTTVNEGRTSVLGWAPLPHNDPRGNEVLDNSKNRELEVKPPQIAPEPVDPELEAEKMVGGRITDGCLYIKFGADSGRISKQPPVTLRPFHAPGKED